MRTAQPLMERLNDWQSHNNNNINSSNSSSSSRGQQVDNTAPLQLASHYTRTLIIRSIYRPFCTFNTRSSSQPTTSSVTEAETEAYTHYRLAAKSAANRFTDFARDISDRQIRAFWPFCKQHHIFSQRPSLPRNDTYYYQELTAIQGVQVAGRPCATSGCFCTRLPLRTRSARSAGRVWTKRGIC